MDSYERLLSVEPHSLAPAEKEKLFKEALAENFEHHFNHCMKYQKLCKVPDCSRCQLWGSRVFL